MTGRRLFTLLILLGVGCAAPPPGAPLTVVIDREASFADRRWAMAELSTARPEPRGLRDALERVLFEPGYPTWQRLAAFDELERRAPAELRRQLRLRLLDLADWDVLEPVLGRVARRGWRDILPAVVASWARPSNTYRDEERPERHVLEKLGGPAPVTDVVAGVFTAPAGRVRAAERAAAWELLTRLMPRSKRVELVATAETDSALLADLARGWRELGVLPETREELLWLSTLSNRSHASFRASARRAVSGLSPDRRRGLALRHLPALAAWPADAPWPSREVLVRSLSATLSERATVLVEPGRGGSLPPQTLADHREALVWADLFILSRTLDALASPEVVESLVAGARADTHDRTSEHGGVLGWGESGGWRAEAWPPYRRLHDRRYIPSPAMIEAMYTGLAHYHFHAVEPDSRPYAIPGGGDLALVERMRFNGLVFTRVGAGRLNADAYFPGRIVVDLGVVGQ